MQERKFLWFIINSQLQTSGLQYILTNAQQTFKVYVFNKDLCKQYN